MTPVRTLLSIALVTTLSACGSSGPPPSDSTQQRPATSDATAKTDAAAPADATASAAYPPGTGPNPSLPEPEKSLVPTVQISPAVGWKDSAQPSPSADFKVGAFAKGFSHPRTLYTLPNGDVLVTETNAPPKPEDAKGVKGTAMKVVMKRAGAGVDSLNRIILLRDKDGDGVAETRTTFLSGLMSPFGMALVGDTFYVANADAVVKVPYKDGETEITAKPVKVADLPGGPINHHWTKSLVASKDGKTLYVGVGSNSNVAENGMPAEKDRAAVLAIDAATGRSRVFASGIRNPTALAWNPTSSALWAVANERDELGNDLVPDYLTSVKEGAFYGWPYSYYGQHVDDRVKPQDPAMVAKAIPPDYALGSHVAALGLAFDTGSALLPARYRDGAFVSLHGSWNRKPQSGYKVVFVPFTGGKPSGPMEDVLGGFVSKDGDAQGRPVGLAFDRQGALLVADDVGNTVWRITPAAGDAPMARASGSN